MNRSYILVGASSGIGKSVAERLAQEGEIVHALSRRGEQADYPPGVIGRSCDASEDEPGFPPIDEPISGLVYLPGTINLRPFHLLRHEDFLRDLEVNYLGAIKTIQHYLPQLKQSGAASIVLMSTVAVQTGLAFHSSIGGAKGAIEGLTRSLAAELAPGIRVNAVAPSLTDTALAEHLLNQPAKREAATKRHPLKRIGLPQDVAGAVRYLLSEDSSWITGQVLAVDGGLSRVRMLA